MILNCSFEAIKPCGSQHGVCLCNQRNSLGGWSSSHRVHLTRNLWAWNRFLMAPIFITRLPWFWRDWNSVIHFTHRFHTICRTGSKTHPRFVSYKTRAPHGHALPMTSNWSIDERNELVSWKPSSIWMEILNDIKVIQKGILGFSLAFLLTVPLICPFWAIHKVTERLDQPWKHRINFAKSNHHGHFSNHWPLYFHGHRPGTRGWSR